MGKVKRFAKWGAIGLAVSAAALAGLAIAAEVSWSSRAAARYDTPAHEYAIPELDDTNRAEAERLYLSRGCGECHGEDGAGRVLVDAPPFRMAPPNVTGVARAMDANDMHRLVRRGIRHDGAPIFFMPAHEYRRMPDEELGLIHAYMRALPEQDAEQPPSELRLLGKVLALLDVFENGLPAELIDQAAPHDPPGPDEMGEYLVMGCTGCHGEHLSGGPVPGAPEDEVGLPSNLTPHETGLADWSEQDFVRAMREGRTPGGGAIDSRFMPVGVYRRLTDDELSAVYAELRSREPRPFGER